MANNETSIHIATAILGKMLDMQPTRIDYTLTAEGLLATAIHRAVNDLEGQGARSDRVALQLLEALARYEFERELEDALRSDLDLAPYGDAVEETEELPAEMMQKLAEKKDPQRDPRMAGNACPPTTFNERVRRGDYR